jgi:ABC-type phosphate transport system ATPase subunit
MSTKKTKKVALKTRINTVFNTTKKMIKNTNDYALTTTEGFITESLNVAEQWQNVTKKAINGAFKLSSGQQDLMFEALETVKGQITHSKKRVKKLLA